ncbi:hypothetical protein R1sor_020194 [Riccia sorocarpa]|uniref:Cilia- and flagella-associated protein 44 n=1 Tax=Riccia sorocarpa TaxID=122646 RepID=A0ABD3IHF4_9MARC
MSEEIPPDRNEEVLERKRSPTTLPTTLADQVNMRPTNKKVKTMEEEEEENRQKYKLPKDAVKMIFSFGFETMKGGTEQMFTAANFSKDGKQLATVGGHPDYWLTVWDWESETMILRSKAFSQEVFKVNFSSYFAGQLITSGVGHIRFWKMASTFTGLKLEGAIAKFGTVPISDVAGYVELRNSKVLSGTESGSILVWDDGLIKAQLKRPGENIMCHNGMIEYITLNEDAKEMTTAGADGFIRFWNLDKPPWWVYFLTKPRKNCKWLDAANDGDDKLVCEINPVREIHLGEGVKIKGILCEADHWIIQDEGGALWKAKLPEYQMEKVLDFHAGPVTCVASSPINYDLVSGGSDGTVRLYSFKQHQQRIWRKFSGGVSSLLWLPLKVEPTGNSVVAGFTDGVVRVLTLATDEWMLTRAMKPHKLDVAALSFSKDGEILATGSKDSTIFFFHCSNSYRALGFCNIPGPITSIDWAPNGNHVLVGCQNGAIVEVTRPGVDGDTSRSFELILPMKAYMFRRPKIKKPKVVSVVKTEELSKGEAPLSAAGSGEEPKTGNVSPDGDGVKNETVEAGTSNDGPKEDQISPGEPQDDAVEKSEEASVTADGNPVNVEGKPGEAQAPVHAVVEEEEPDDPPGTSFPVRALMYTHGNLGTFYLTVEGLASGYLYECHIDSEEVLGYTKWLGPVQFLHFTHSSQFIISGSDDGMVRVQKVPPPSQLKLAEASYYWEGGIHDAFYGVVGGAVLSFDEKFLASVSYDGSFFVQSINMEMALEMPHYNPPPGAKPEEKLTAETEDVSEDTLSIEEQRAKTEQDERLRLAMEKKNVVLAKVDTLRNSLAALIKEMNERERNEKLPMEHFEVDPHVRIMLAEEEKREVEQAQKELQWDSEKRNVALQKLKAWYLDPVEVERIVLHAFKSGQVVSSFRTAKLSPEMQEAIAEAKKQKGVRRWTKLQRGRETYYDIKEKEEVEEVVIEPKTTDAEEDDIEAEKKRIEEFSKAEQRRLMLKIRDREMAKYMSTKPDETWVSEEDAAAIDDAENNKGDFKLKSDPAYVVPDELREAREYEEKKKSAEEAALKLAEQESQHTKLRYEKRVLLERNAAIISNFDNDLENLRANRFSLEVNIKAAALKMMALYQELRYLQKTQPVEESLDKKIREKMKAVFDMKVKLDEQEKLMEAKKEEITLLINRRLEIVNEFDRIFSEPDDPQKPILHKLFIKIIRRVKRNPDGTLADSDEDSDLEETVADGDEEDYEDDDVIEVCPPNVTQQFYDQMFKLRERRVEEDWLIKEANKALDALTRERDNIVKKKKLTDASLESGEKEIAVFQKEKQFSLNEIDIVLSLKMHQIEYLEDGEMPEDLSGGLVFDNAVFQNLKDIIADHMKAKLSLKELHTELRKEHQALSREKRIEEERTTHIEARCVEVQMLKFGQVIDMEVLDVISKDMKKDTKELKEQLRTQESQHGLAIHEWNKKIEEATDDLAACTKENSQVLHTIADLKTKQNYLTAGMKARVIATLKDPLVEKSKHASEHSRLCEIIQTQDALIQKMQQDITQMRTDLDKLYPAPIDEASIQRYSGLLG